MRPVYSTPVLVLLAILAHAAPSPGAMMAPPPTVLWEELAGSELVVVAKYDHHKDGKLSLKVERVLKGPAKVGDVIAVTLKDPYSVQTGPVWPQAFGRPATQPDGIPRLCIARQIINPGGAVPGQIVPDVRQPEIYFFAKSADPALEYDGQVQPLMFEADWIAVLAGKSGSVPFRLAQVRHASVRRAALEELYVGRDAKVFNQLFDWMLSDPFAGYDTHYEPHQDLAVVGQGHRDVYDMALELVKSGKVKWQDHRFGEVLGRCDSERAFGDLSQWIEKGPKDLKWFAAESLGYCRSAKALDLALKLLEDPELGNHVIWPLRIMVPDRQTSYGLPGLPEEQANEAIRRVRAILQMPGVTPFVKQEVANAFFQRLHEPATLDPAAAEKALVDNWSGPETRYWLEAIRHALDPKCVPVLVRVLRDVPAAARPNVYDDFRYIIDQYADKFPDAMQAELVRQKVPGRPEPTGMVAFDVRQHLRAIFKDSTGRTSVLRELARFPGGREWLAAHKPNKAMVDELIDVMDTRAEYLTASDLAILFDYDPNRATPLLEKSLAIRDQIEPWWRAPLLAVAIRQGRKDLAGELITAVGELLARERAESKHPSCYRSLMEAGDETSIKEYLLLLDGMPHVYQTRYFSNECANSTYQSLLTDLADARPGEFVKRVLPLLESTSLTERMMGVESLAAGLQWNFNFRAEAFAPQRAEMLRTIRPLLDEIARMKPEAVPAYVQKMKKTQK